MPWSGGTFTRTNGVHTGSTLWVQDRDAGTKILATRHDTHDQDLADGINATLEKSGSNAATGNLDIGSNRLTLVADGTAKTDAATVNQIQSNGPAFQATDTGTANAYVIALSPAITAYAAGQEITFKAGAASTTASTLNVNTLGTKALKKLHDQDIASGDIETGSIVTAVYDGTNFQVTSQLATEGGTPGGSNTQVQYNSSSAFAGSAHFTFDGTSATVANPLFLPDGSASAPALSNTGDTNTGIAFIAADTVGVVTGGTEQFRFGSNPIPGGNKNLLINGDMRVAQRGTSFTGVQTGTAPYTLDRWGWIDNGTTSLVVTITQDTDVPTVAEAGVNFENSFKIDVTTAETIGTDDDEQVYLRQTIEAQNVTFLGHGSTGALACTLSFWVKSTKTGIFCVLVQRPDASEHYIVEVTIDSSNTWEKKSVLIPGDTSGTAIADDNGAGLIVNFVMAVGTNIDGGTADVWQADSSSTRATSNQVNLMDSTSNNVLFTGVQYEVGSIPTSFQQNLISDELARCLRYYQRVDGAYPLPWTVVIGTATSGYAYYRLHPTLRANPTIVTTDAGSDSVVAANSDRFSSYSSHYVYEPDAGYFAFVLSGATAGDCGRWVLGAGSLVTWDAEL
jgi:hypothetical protein